eukprot:2594642-Lingulodinium_polyedra.AAC.1
MQTHSATAGKSDHGSAMPPSTTHPRTLCIDPDVGGDPLVANASHRIVYCLSRLPVSLASTSAYSDACLRSGSNSRQAQLKCSIGASEGIKAGTKLLVLRQEHRLDCSGCTGLQSHHQSGDGGRNVVPVANDTGAVIALDVLDGHLRQVEGLAWHLHGGHKGGLAHKRALLLH